MQEDRKLKKAHPNYRETLSQKEMKNRTTKGQRLYFSGKVSPAKHKALGTMVNTAKNTKQNKHRLTFIQRPRKAVCSLFFIYNYNFISLS